ncbi:hypothetical protein HN682_02090 [Candidatus Peregrinibacteria bacterium]|jgi:hypothetical protein|nr:hypothetical protein [Candidatus Peregrinibacteria bacterium]
MSDSEIYGAGIRLGYINDGSEGLNIPAVNTAENVFDGPSPTSSSSTRGQIISQLRGVSTKKELPIHLSEKISSSSQYDLANSGAVIFIKDKASSNINYMTNRFYLSALDITQKERAQIQNTFGAASVALFGDSVKIYTFSGTALEHTSTKAKGAPSDYFHGSSLLDLYNNHMRGTQLVDDGSVAIMRIMNHTIWGYPLTFNYRNIATADKYIEFGMSWVVTNHSLAMESLVTDNQLENHYDLSSYYDTNNEDITAQIGDLKNDIDVLKDTIDIIEIFINNVYSYTPTVITEERETIFQGIERVANMLKIRIRTIPQFFPTEEEVDSYANNLKNAVTEEFTVSNALPHQSKSNEHYIRLIQIYRLLFNKLMLVYGGNHALAF